MHRRQATFSMNTPDHAITRDLFPFSDDIEATQSRLLRFWKIAHKEMFKSLHVSLGSVSVGCRHLEWLPVPGSVSPVCPSSSGVGQRRERLMYLIVRGIRVLVFQRLQDCHIACIPGFQLAFNSDGRVGVWQVFPCRSHVCLLF